MADLGTLIRWHRWRLDEKRRALADLQSMADRLGAQRDRLGEELDRERAVAAGSALPPPNFGAYVAAMLGRREALSRSIRQVEQQIEAAAGEITAAFQELKTCELAQAGRDRRVRLRNQQIETATLDEIAVTGHRRRKAAEAADKN